MSGQGEAGGDVDDDIDTVTEIDEAGQHRRPIRVVHARLVKRRHPHFTPTSTSWLNVVEGRFPLLTRRCLQRGAFQSTDALEAAIAA